MLSTENNELLFRGSLGAPMGELMCRCIGSESAGSLSHLVPSGRWPCRAFGESGFPTVASEACIGIYASDTMPETIVVALRTEFRAIMKLPDVREALLEFSNPARFDARRFWLS